MSKCLYINLNVKTFKVNSYFPCHVDPCHQGMAHPRVADGRDVLQMWRVARNLMNSRG